MPPDETPTSPKAKRSRKSSTPRAKASIDPGIKAIREKMALEVAAYRSAQASSKILDKIVTKLAPKLTPEDRQGLIYKLSKTETPSLLPSDREDASESMAK